MSLGRHSACAYLSPSIVTKCEGLPSGAASDRNALTIGNIGSRLKPRTPSPANNQRSEGDYCYIYDALEGEVKRRPSNLVRAAGCAYAMASAGRVVPAELSHRVRVSAKRAIEALVHRAVRWGDEGLMIAEAAEGRLWGKLGSVALTAVALLELDDAGFHPHVLMALLSTLKRSQRSDGYFECFLGTDKASDSVINFYPGDALLALAISAARGDEEALASCRRAFGPYRRHFLSTPASAFVGWQVDVWSRLALLTQSEKYADFAFAQLDWLLQFQLREGPYVGGFSLPGKRVNASSCVYTEAMIRGALLARALDISQLQDKYARASMAGLRFCTQLQIDASVASILPDGSRALGGVTGGLQSFVVRSDNVQHSITMAQVALENMAALAHTCVLATT